MNEFRLSPDARIARRRSLLTPEESAMTPENALKSFSERCSRNHQEFRDAVRKHETTFALACERVFEAYATKGDVSIPCEDLLSEMRRSCPGLAYLRYERKHDRLLRSCWLLHRYGARACGSAQIVADVFVVYDFLKRGVVPKQYMYHEEAKFQDMVEDFLEEEEWLMEVCMDGAGRVLDGRLLLVDFADETKALRADAGLENADERLVRRMCDAFEYHPYFRLLSLVGREDFTVSDVREWECARV